MDKRPKLIIYGAGDMGGRFACEYRDLGKYAEKFNLVGFIDDDKNKHKTICDFPVLGTSSEFPHLLNQGIDHVLISLLSDPVKRLEKFIQLEEMGFKFPSVYNKYFPKEAKIGKGIYVHNSASFIGYAFEIGDFSVISANAIVDSRAKIGKGVIMSPNTFVSFDAQIGDATVLHPYSSVNKGVTVGARCVIYPYILVHKNLPDNTLKKRSDVI